MAVKEGTIWKVLVDASPRQNVVSVFAASPERPLYDREAKKTKTDSDGKPIYPLSTNARIVAFKSEGGPTFTFDRVANLRKGDVVTVVGPLSTTYSYLKAETYVKGTRDYVDVKDVPQPVIRERVKAGELIEVVELQVQAFEVYVHNKEDRSGSSSNSSERDSGNDGQVPAFL